MSTVVKKKKYNINLSRLLFNYYFNVFITFFPRQIQISVKHTSRMNPFSGILSFTHQYTGIFDILITNWLCITNSLGYVLRTGYLELQPELKDFAVKYKKYVSLTINKFYNIQVEFSW